MQSLKDYGLHIVDAAYIAHHLKFANFNEPIPWDIAQVFNNPMHIVTVVISFIIIQFLVYKLFQAWIHKFLKAKLPKNIAVHIPTAPPAYIHNDPRDIPMVNFTSIYSHYFVTLSFIFDPLQTRGEISVKLFSRLDTSLSLSLINILAPPSAPGSTFSRLFDHMTMTPEQTHINDQIYKYVFTIVSSVINLT
jgi:hypothetical protein